MHINSRRIIFVAGIHGVGKTTLCNELSSQFGIEHFSASSLIAKEKEEKYLHDKRVENVGENQDHLLVAINKSFDSADWYLLDGHFCLLNRNNKITRIPYSTYEGISPMAVLVLFDEPFEIYSRLSSRDNAKYEIALLKSLQEEEIARQG